MTKTTAEQALALRESAGLRMRDDLVLVGVRGDDAESWLNGQITNDIRGLEPGRARYALAVNVRGKIIAELWVAGGARELSVLIPRSAQAAVLQSFDSQIIMEDVTLAPEPELRIISIQGPRALEALGAATAHPTLCCDELGDGGVFVLVPGAELDRTFAELEQRVASVGGTSVDQHGFELARLRAGRGRFGCDFGEQNYPQEAGLKALAVSFNKGCYLGQEVVCTLENRGRLTRRLVTLEAEGEIALSNGQELVDAEGQAVGQVTSSAFDAATGRTLALGYVKQARVQLGAQLASGAARVRVIANAGCD